MCRFPKDPTGGLFDFNKDGRLDAAEYSVMEQAVYHSNDAYEDDAIDDPDDDSENGDFDDMLDDEPDDADLDDFDDDL